MFKLLEFLDKLRRAENSEINTEQLISILRKGNDRNTSLSSYEKSIFKGLNEASTQGQLESIDKIISNFNSNWRNRKRIFNKLEEMMAKGDLKMAEDYYLANPGSLILSQYKQLWCRYIKKNPLFIAIEYEMKEYNFETADVIYNSRDWHGCDDSYEKLKDKYKAKLNQLKQDLLFDIKQNLLNYNFQQAKEIYDKNHGFINKENYIAELKKYMELYLTKELSVYKFDTTDEFYRRNSDVISARLYNEQKSKYINLRMLELLKNYKFNEAEGFYKEYKEYIDAAKYAYNGNQYACEFLLSKLKAFDFVGANKFYAKHTYCLTEKEYLLNKAIYAKRLLELYLERFDFDSAMRIYKENSTLITSEEYIRLKEVYEKKRKEKFDADMLNLFDRGSLEGVKMLYNKNISWLNEKSQKYIEEYKKYQKLKEIMLRIDDLKRICKYYKGISAQRNVFERVIEELRGYYRNNNENFTDDLIREISGCGKHIEKYDEVYDEVSKKEKSNIIETEAGINEKRVAVFHIREYYVGKVIGSRNNNEYEVKISADETKWASKRDLMVIGKYNSTNYISHCYNCRKIIDGDVLELCLKCKWYICSECGACGCGYGSLNYSSD